MQNFSHSNRNYWRFILILAGGILIFTLAQTLHFGIEEDSVRTLIRWSVRLGGLSFALAFGASSLHFVFKGNWTKILLDFRPLLGLSFVVFHTFHLFSLIWLQIDIHPVFSLAKKVSLIGGGIAYLFMYAMAFTTFPNIKKSMSTDNWKLLHLLGGYWIWIIFFRSYMLNVLNHDRYHVLLAIFSLVIILRLWKIIRLRITRKQGKSIPLNQETSS